MDFKNNKQFGYFSLGQIHQMSFHEFWMQVATQNKMKTNTMMDEWSILLDS